jgi:hypothetical protein
LPGVFRSYWSSFFAKARFSEDLFTRRSRFASPLGNEECALEVLLEALPVCCRIFECKLDFVRFLQNLSLKRSQYGLFFRLDSFEGKVKQ